MKDSKEFWDKTAEKYLKSPLKDEATYQQKLAITREFLKIKHSDPIDLISLKKQ